MYYNVRKLGIPVVMDRIVAVSMHNVLEALFDADFTGSNFGFRRGKSQHQAIGHLQGLVKEGKEWAVAIDLDSFFDEIPHALTLTGIDPPLLAKTDPLIFPPSTPACF